MYISDRYGCPLAFPSGKEHIGVLYRSVQDRLHGHAGQPVIKLEDLKDRVRVITDSRVAYEDDLVVGADVAHSEVRSEMWSF